jgi:hypothetical protein
VKDHPVVWALTAWAFVAVVIGCLERFVPSSYHHSVGQEITIAVLLGAIPAIVVLVKSRL